jgi:hypothetical protein
LAAKNKTSGPNSSTVLIKALLERGAAGVGSVIFAEFSVGCVTQLFQIQVVDFGSVGLIMGFKPESDQISDCFHSLICCRLDSLEICMLPKVNHISIKPYRPKCEPLRPVDSFYRCPV